MKKVLIAVLLLSTLAARPQTTTTYDTFDPVTGAFGKKLSVTSIPLPNTPNGYFTRYGTFGNFYDTARAAFSGTANRITITAGVIDIGTDVVTLAGTQTLINKTLTSPVINVSSDATGDIYYRSSGGLFTRLAIGSAQQHLVGGTIPHWVDTATAGAGGPATDVNIPTTTSLAVGTIRQNGGRFIHTFGIGNTFLGDSAGNFITTSAFGQNTGIGNNVLPAITSAFRNTAIGYRAMLADTSGSNNVALGYFALSANLSGSQNTAIGATALQNNTTGNQNTAVGINTLPANTTGNTNVAIGFNAMQLNTTGASNNAMGANAMQRNTTGSNNTAVGEGALQNKSTGDGNTAIGTGAIAAFGTMSGNVGVGYNALNSVTGDYNVAAGQQALNSSTSATENVAFGLQSMFRNTTGNYNTAIGSGSMFGISGNATYSNNISIGYKSARYNIADNGLFINSIDRTNYTGDTTNSIIYGVQSSTAANQRLKLGGGGNVGIDIYPMEKLSVNGNVLATQFKTSSTVFWSSGTGSPEGVVTAAVASMYTRTDGGAGTTLYVKETGAGNTGWVAK